MIDAGALILDQLIQLVTVRGRNREKYFNNYIEPLYREAEQIAKDYMALFAELISKIEAA